MQISEAFTYSSKNHLLIKCLNKINAASQIFNLKLTMTYVTKDLTDLNVKI